MYHLGDNYANVYFTKREAQCMALFLKGYTVYQASVRLGLSSRTVEFYLKNMRIKLNCSSKNELMAKVIHTDFMANLQEIIEEI